MDSTLQTGFIRNRRFLIGVSLGLACAQYLGLEVNNISVLGNSAVVNKKDHIEILLLMVWIWAWIKYCLWFRDISAWGEIVASVQDQTQKTLEKRSQCIEVPDEVKNELGDKADHHLMSGDWRSRNHKFEASVRGFRGDPFGAPITLVDLTGRLLATYNDKMPNNYMVQETDYTLPIDDTTYRRYRRRAYMHTLLTRRYFVEYLAPFIIGTAPLIAWSGSVYTWVVNKLTC